MTSVRDIDKAYIDGPNVSKTVKWYGMTISLPFVFIAYFM